MIATVMAVRAAMGLMACRMEVVVKNVTKAKNETKKSNVPIAILLWLTSSTSHLSLSIVKGFFDLMLSYRTRCSRIRTASRTTLNCKDR